MNIRRTLERIRGAATDGEELRRAARDLGHELTRNRVEVLREFRAELARLPEKGTAEFVLGYRNALRDVVAAFEAAVQPAQEEERALSFARATENARSILEQLADGPARPSELASRLGLDPSVVSRSLGRLRAASLAESLPASESMDGRSRLHMITLRGERVLGQLPRSQVTRTNEAVLQIAASFLERVLTEGRVRPPISARYGEGERSLDPAPFAHWLGETCVRRGLLSRVAGDVYASPTRSTDALWASMEVALKRGGAPDFLAELANAVPTKETLLVRSGNPDLWRIFLRAGWKAFPQQDTLEWQDLAAGDPVPERKPIVIFYDSVALLLQDLADNSFVAHRTAADFHFVATAPGAEPVPEPFRAIETAACA
jgi:DNA-binding MarR family transcriptional regulator